MNPIKILFILFSLFTFHFSLFARDALPVLVEGGEPFENREDFYIANQSIISAIAISPNGKIIVSGSENGIIRILDIENNREIKIMNQHKIDIMRDNGIRTIIISPSGRFFISFSYDNFFIKIWDMKSGEEIKRLDGQKLYEHYLSTSIIAISPNDKNIVFGSGDGTIKIWDIKSGKEVNSLKGHTNSIFSILISSDGKNIVSASVDGIIKIWDMKSGKEIKNLKIDKNTVSIAMSPNDRTIVSGSYDGTINIWDIESAKKLKSLKGSNDSTKISIAISSNNKNIVSSSYNREIIIWDIESGKLLKSLSNNNEVVFSTIISPDGKSIISKDFFGIKIWDIDTMKKVKEYSSRTNGTWIVFDYKQKKFFRGDNGTLLYKKNEKDLLLVLPTLLKKESVELNACHNITINDTVYSYQVNIKNTSTEPLYWIKSSYHDKYCTIKEQIISKIKPQEEANLTLIFDCSLPQKNPKPLKHKINLMLETATKNKFKIPLTISIAYADINITKAEVSEDGKNLNIEIKNIGNKDLVNAKIKLLKPFEADIQELSKLEVNTTKAISYVLPFLGIDKNATLDLTVFIPNSKLEKENPNTDIAPSYEWKIKDINISKIKTAWYIYALLILIILLLLLLIWYLLTKTPKSITTLSPTALKKAKEKLEAKGQWETTLQLAKTTNKKVENALKFYQNSTVDILTSHLNITHTQKAEFHKLKTPNLGLI